jgi:cytochrome c553
MTRAIRIAKRVLAVLLAVVGVAVAALYGWSTWRLRRHYEVPVARVAIPTDAAALERGGHLANNVALCSHCHGEDFGGTSFFDGGAMVARLPAPNLTRGRGGVTAGYTDIDWVRAVRHGVAPGGRALVYMPSAEFANVSAEDLGAIIAYVKSRPPVDRAWPAVSVGPVGRGLLLANTKKLLPVLAIDHTRPLAAALAPDNPVAWGQHLVSTAGCRGCHSDTLTGGEGPPPGAANITPVGLQAWSEQDFMRALRTGVAPGQRALDPAMPRAYGLMTDAELQAIWAYLKTVPAQGEKTARQQAGPSGTATSSASTARSSAATAP